MAEEFSFSLQQRAPKLRPCTVNGVKALFHRWEEYAAVIGPSLTIGGHTGGQIRETYAIVELENGQVKEVEPSKVVFSDTSEHMVMEITNLAEVVNAGEKNDGR